MKYLKVYTDFVKSIEPLSSAERGRLFTAMLEYADNGTEPEFSGNERFIWPTAKSNIDRESDFCKKQKENALKGARNTKRAESQTKPNRAKRSQTEPNEANVSLKEKKRKEMKRNEDNETSSLRSEVSCAEQKTCSTPSEFSLLLNDGSEYMISAEQIERWKALYAAVDVDQELRNMAGWCEANPKKRKTKRGILAFVNTWLAREQNRPHTAAYGGQKTTGNVFLDIAREEGIVP